MSATLHTAVSSQTRLGSCYLLGALPLSLIIVFKVIRTPMGHLLGDRHLLRISH